MFLWELSMFLYTTAQKTTCQSSVYVWNTNGFTPDHRPATSHHRSSDQTPTKRSRPPVDCMSWLEIHWSFEGVKREVKRLQGPPRQLQLGKFERVFNVFTFCLVVSTPLNGNLPQVGVKIKSLWNHNLDITLLIFLRDCWASLFPNKIPGRLVCIWIYHSRLYQAYRRKFMVQANNMNLDHPNQSLNKSYPPSWQLTLKNGGWRLEDDPASSWVLVTFELF